MLQKLDLSDTDLSDEDVTYLANSLANNCVLRHLDLAVNSRVTEAGWRALSTVLQNHNSALEKVDIGYSSINDDALVSFEDSLMHNNKLKELILDSTEHINFIRLEAFSNILCKQSSIDATFNSNHTLQKVFEYSVVESNLPSDLRALLQLNRENTKTEAARRKILQVHFSGSFNMQPFIDMDLTVLPHAVAWMARDEHGSSLLYQFVRNTTLFVDVDVGGEV